MGRSDGWNTKCSLPLAGFFLLFLSIIVIIIYFIYSEPIVQPNLFFYSHWKKSNFSLIKETQNTTVAPEILQKPLVNQSSRAGEDFLKLMILKAQKSLLQRGIRGEVRLHTNTTAHESSSTCRQFRNWKDTTKIVHPVRNKEIVGLVKQRHHRVVFQTLAGQLGNFINQVCSLYLLANHTGNMFVTEYNVYYSWFPNLISNIVSKDVFHQLVKDEGIQDSMITGTRRDAEHIDVAKMIQLAGQGSIWIQGQFMTTECVQVFQEQAVPIKEIFRFSGSVYKTAQTVWDCLSLQFIDPYLRRKHISKSNVTFIAVHNRRGDFIIAHRPLSTPEGLLKSMKAFEDKYAPVFFLMATDDPSWAMRFVVPKRDNILIVSDFTPRDDPRLDFVLLSQCKHTIHTNGSTFGMLIGFFAGGEVQIV